MLLGFKFENKCFLLGFFVHSLAIGFLPISIKVKAIRKSEECACVSQLRICMICERIICISNTCLVIISEVFSE